MTWKYRIIKRKYKETDVKKDQPVLTEEDFKC